MRLGQTETKLEITLFLRFLIVNFMFLNKVDRFHFLNNSLVMLAVELVCVFNKRKIPDVTCDIPLG